MESLPNELLDHVLAQVPHSDDSLGSTITLASCCLVSQRFYKAAQPLLYRDIHLGVQADGLTHLLNALKSRPQLAGAVKELSIESGSRRRISTPTHQQVNLFRDFLEEALPPLINLTTFRSRFYVITGQLLRNTLYKTGYQMSVPTDLGNLRILELCARDLVYKFNYILRLPRLERVVLHETTMIDNDLVDATLSNDWGWTSHSIKELVLHQGPNEHDANISLMSNSLQALARCMPDLEHLRIYHNGLKLFPYNTAHLLAFFAAQLRSSLRRLTLIIEDSCGHSDSGLSMLAHLKTSNIEVLNIDLHIICPTIPRMDLTDRLFAGTLPASLRHLHLRYVEMKDTSDVNNANPPVHWDWEPLVQQVVRGLPALATIDVELHLLEKIDLLITRRYIEAFGRNGIRLNIQAKEKSVRHSRGLLIADQRRAIPE